MQVKPDFIDGDEVASLVRTHVLIAVDALMQYGAYCKQSAWDQATPEQRYQDLVLQVTGSVDEAKANELRDFVTESVSNATESAYIIDQRGNHVPLKEVAQLTFAMLTARGMLISP